MSIDPYAVFVMGLALVLLSLLVLYSAMWRKGENQRVQQTQRLVTVVQCGKDIRIRNYMEGDYVGKTVGDECDEGSPMVIGIYRE